jgi:hypothetical protein
MGPLRCVASVPIDGPGERGDRIQLAFPSDQIFLFDQETGQRIG